jgi:putative ABC transport system permease protein
MVGTMTVFEQLKFMQSQDLGVDIDQTLVLTGPNITDSLYDDKFNTFKQTLSSYPRISSIASSTSVPGNQPGWNAGGIRLVEETDAESNQYRVIGFDGDFIDAYGLEMVAGRKFDLERSNEEYKVMFNESAVKLLGFATAEEVLNRDLFFWGDTFQIIGVLKDYHQESIKKSFEPLVFRFMPNAGNFYSLKVQSDHIPETIELVREEWQASFPGNPFDYFFLDDHYNKQYKADMQFGKVFSLFASLAIFIACLGLFGLASYMTMQRTKEIGVRKVLGASILSILLLLSKDFSRFIITAVVLAMPISWYFIDSWLQGFALKINISWWLFAVPAVALMIIALTTISFQTVRSALTNPVNSLRDE